MSDVSWYCQGLRFECTRCGNCCSGESGTISVTDSDIDVISVYLGLSRAVFCEIYVRILWDDTASLREKSNGDCIFFRHSEGCIIYDYRPRQCRTWPFWQSVIGSPETWEIQAKNCAGMNRGPLYPFEYIKNVSKNDGTRGNILNHT